MLARLLKLPTPTPNPTTTTSTSNELCPHLIPSAVSSDCSHSRPLSFPLTRTLARGRTASSSSRCALCSSTSLPPLHCSSVGDSESRFVHSLLPLRASSFAHIRLQIQRNTISKAQILKMEPSKVSIFTVHDKPKGQGGSGSFATYMIIARMCPDLLLRY